MPQEEIEEVLVPCPSCRKVHRVSVKEARENPRVTVECGAMIGSAGVLRRAEEAEERARQFRDTLYKLE